MVEWVEVKGVSVDVAVKAALEELGIEDEKRVEVKVLQEPQRGFLGIGRQDAIVHVKPRSRRRRKKQAKHRPRRESRTGKQARSSKGQSRPKAQKKGARSKPDGKQAKSARPSSQEKKATAGRVAEREVRPVAGDDGRATALGKEQAEVVEAFLGGLLERFGLEGRVETRFDGRVLHANVIGDQTEALVGPKATVMQALHELTKTVVQRRTARNCRLRLDVAGYGERRRKALAIYAAQLAEQALEEAGEIMLEPMNASDRKVVHDAVAAVEGVRSYSEGAEPRRSVVISPE